MQNERIRIAPKHEYAITIEQITVRFLINGINNHREMDGVHEQMLRTNLHTHAYGEMFLCHKKAARVNFSQGFITLEPGDLLYVPANVPHVCAINESETGPLAFGIQFTQKGNPESHGLQKFLSPLSDSA